MITPIFTLILLVRDCMILLLLNVSLCLYIIKLEKSVDCILFTLI
ncbi:hypothetical protein LTSEGIV_2033 [Salmonella enterica subsp. enterica serovar Give str. S5-487]|nr:hypothetical protein LTSEGIV_2033 [Salmonella enterica subsp. enterica serovar Give str. S5-487]